MVGEVEPLGTLEISKGTNASKMRTERSPHKRAKGTHKKPKIHTERGIAILIIAIGIEFRVRIHQRGEKFALVHLKVSKSS